MKIHENFHVKDKFIMIKVSKYLKKVSKYLVSFSGLWNFVQLETNAFTFRLFYVSICF